ncbi:MAG: hypothetical protein ACJA2W_002940 [Planctomycetota bacterium]|jgi:hypothetical protein
MQPADLPCFASFLTLAPVQEITSDDTFALVGLVSVIALLAGLADIVQRRMGKGFPIPLLIYSHLAAILVFVYVMLSLLDDVEGEVGHWPLYVALLPLPFIVLGRVLPVKSAAD